MPEVILEDGSKMETSLPPEALADLQKEPAAPAAEPAKEPEKKPEPPAKPAETKTEEPKPEPAKEPAKDPEPAKPRKATPIANLLNQRHELEQQLASEKSAREAEAKRATDLEAKLTELSKAPATPATADKIADLAKKYNVNADLLKELVATLGPAQKVELPKEVQDLIADRQRQQVIDAETKAFNTRVDKLSAVLTDEPIKEHRDKLMELAYSTDAAPDGERYCDKELSELYFGFIKPTIEPGKVSAEASRRAPATTKVVDFEEIFNRDDPKDIEAMDSATFQKYTTWLTEKAGDVPIKRSH